MRSPLLRFCAPFATASGLSASCARCYASGKNESPDEGLTASAITDEGLTAAAMFLCRARRVVAFTGAGISAESGIPTYRDAFDGQGIWDGLLGQLGMLFFGTRFGFLFLPRTAWSCYCERLLLPIAQAEPNAGHKALAELGKLLEADVAVITQNVDGLHQRAGSTRVLELHGTCMTHRNAWTGQAVSCLV
mmetsp:Transcript_1133/g.1895  ORF Transcript_1133/g.1895 Transcript_1133/m.1895 type:complete len:191 (-) Transcript_1133:30-602(-)|eukprot:CAMPEP_0119345960 /NCGR_PEP_ID=MMETSP1333-20130426/107758_1 /TAXON_ID=418940 /ORGANISM="Scyphosphaera apsteinii, Strain RCC1455" /LENGTH=190 /DNA_ID=CAMNT_0007358449 /DNA_START=29 /DNA_END=601 /DNA_ORIENTATION=-